MPLFFGEIKNMFSSPENSPYGVLPEHTIPLVEIEESLCEPYIHGQTVKVKKLPRFQPVCHIIIRPPEAKQVVVEESFEQDFIQQKYTTVDLSKLSRYKRTAEQKEVMQEVDIEVDISPPDNLIRLKTAHIKNFPKILQTKSGLIKDVFIKEYLPQILGIDEASAYVEAFAKDGLGLSEFEISVDMIPYIHNAIKTDFVSLILKQLTNLSEETRQAYIIGYVTDALASARYLAKNNLAAQQHRRYQERLDNPAGYVAGVGMKKSKVIRDGKADKEKEANR